MLHKGEAPAPLASFTIASFVPAWVQPKLCKLAFQPVSGIHLHFSQTHERSRTAPKQRQPQENPRVRCLRRGQQGRQWQGQEHLTESSAEQKQSTTHAHQLTHQLTDRKEDTSAKLAMSAAGMAPRYVTHKGTSRSTHTVTGGVGRTCHAVGREPQRCCQQTQTHRDPIHTAATQPPWWPPRHAQLASWRKRAPLRVREGEREGRRESPPTPQTHYSVLMQLLLEPNRMHANKRDKGKEGTG